MYIKVAHDVCVDGVLLAELGGESSGLTAQVEHQELVSPQPAVCGDHRAWLITASLPYALITLQVRVATITLHSLLQDHTYCCCDAKPPIH